MPVPWSLQMDIYEGSEMQGKWGYFYNILLGALAD